MTRPDYRFQALRSARDAWRNRLRLGLTRSHKETL